MSSSRASLTAGSFRSGSCLSLDQEVGLLRSESCLLVDREAGLLWSEPRLTSDGEACRSGLGSRLSVDREVGLLWSDLSVSRSRSWPEGRQVRVPWGIRSRHRGGSPARSLSREVFWFRFASGRTLILRTEGILPSIRWSVRPSLVEFQEPLRLRVGGSMSLAGYLI